MKYRVLIYIGLFFIFSQEVYAYRVIEDIATKAGGYDIPIKIYLPEQANGSFPVMFFVHGGGWNGGDENSVPDASIPNDASYLCDEMGIIYVGLAYRCKGNNGTFHLALEDLQASIKWFEYRADEFNADMSRIGFSGGSAGTTLSAVLAQRYSNCVVYVGREGMYNVLDLDSTLSNFPDARSRADFGLVSNEQKLEASPYHNLRKNPASALLLQGKDDWLCHYTQSVKYAEKLREAGAEVKLVLYDGINHTCLNVSYPEVFRNSMMEIAHIYAKEYGVEDVDFEAIQEQVNERTAPLLPYKNIPDNKLIGSWNSSKYGTFTFEDGGKGSYVNKFGNQEEDFSYKNNGSYFSVSVDGEDADRTFFLRKNDRTIYELITEENRYKSRRNDYHKL